MQRTAMASKLTDKLQIKPAMRIMLLNMPTGYDQALKPLPKDVTVIAQPRTTVDLVQFFCRSMEELRDGLPRAIEHLKDDGIFWICWPKQSSKVSTDLNRDILWRVLLQAKYKPVAAISIDNIWSALRFRPSQ